MMQSKFAYLALVYLGLMTLADSVTDSLLPALADDAHTRSGRWNLATAALIFKGVSDIIGQFVIGYFLNTKSRHHAMNINTTSILVASLVTLLSLFYEQQWPVLVAIVGPLVRCIGGGSHASSFLVLAILHDQNPPHHRFTSYYWTGATSVLAQALGPFFASILADQSRVLPGILSGTCCLVGFGIIDSLKPPPYESNNSSHDESTSLLPNNQNDVELKTLSISVTEYLSRCFGKKSLIRSSSLIFLPQVLFLMAICKSTRPLFKTYIQHRDDVSPTEAEALWLLRSVMSVLIFGIILPAIVLGTAPRISYPNSINLRVARISVLFISTGAFMIGLSGSLRSITTALVINTFGVAIDLSLLALASCSFSSSDAGTVMMTLASIESAGTLLGIGVLYPIYQWSINEDLPFLAGGVPYYICGSLYAVTAVVVWSLRTRRQAPDS
ncbi:MFS efflux pump atnC [Fusarium oxysporum f. sp. cubense]|uniref:MFS efflux pump atnC n=1 Tax=Fusarium oxysporum f. sp. cubense TaxID=61366 RepID=A0A559L2F2_FUSOC|nr:MFS efflux pump atnC [Fusarium oxysporum f. sp. cubense]